VVETKAPLQSGDSADGSDTNSFYARFKKVVTGCDGIARETLHVKTRYQALGALRA